MPQHRCFSVNTVQFLGTYILNSICERLHLFNAEYLRWCPHTFAEALRGSLESFYLTQQAFICFNNKNTRKRCEIWVNTLEWHQCRRFGVFIVNFEHILYFFLMFLLLLSTLKCLLGRIFSSYWKWKLISFRSSNSSYISGHS